MNIDRVDSGRDIPNDFNVIIEIPAHADPVKYEVDKETGAMFVDRFLSTPMRYPCNYGYVPRTLSGDGDPVDVLVITPFPLFPGVVVRCRAIGMLKMEDEAGEDTKVLAVPVNKLTTFYSNIVTAHDLPEERLAHICHFFQHYKDLEEGKWVKVTGWFGPDEAKKDIMDGVDTYQRARKKPAF
ncbi:MAG TPA: inorganic diphosphatase [Burkholderiales bacterium]